MTQSHIAVIDIGKTNAKLVVVDAGDLSEVAVRTRPNTVLPGPPWPHFDVEGHWRFLLKGLSDFHQHYGIDAISITTHGACAALLDADGGLVAPVLDYEFSGPDATTQAYQKIRPAFCETGSPLLAGGLNIGAQLYWQFQQDPDLKRRTHRIVTYPQYWAGKLTGEMAMDVTSLGCHTDLWNPHKGVFSTLVDRLGIAKKLPDVRKPSDIIGTILPKVATETGLSPETPVYCGIHDSNASLLPYLIDKKPPFSVVSSGTWVIAMSIGGRPVELDPARDMLINVTAHGAPALSARFMGGREHDIAMGGAYPTPKSEDVRSILNNQVMVLPAIVPETGPFKGRVAQWIVEEPSRGTAQRAVAVAFYLALMTAECLDKIGHEGDIIVEGPFSKNKVYLDMLAVAVQSEVFGASGQTGTSTGAAILVTGKTSGHDLDRVEVNARQGMHAYAARWRQLVRT